LSPNGCSNIISHDKYLDTFTSNAKIKRK